ncbi:putative cytochromeB2-like isoform X1 [Capsicum annuum]|nr:putative cytochromeB2-like isoform X1 [Capsicum annuum]
MGVVAKRLSRALWSAAFSSSACGSTISRALSTCIQSKNCPYNQSLFSSAWSATQRRGVKSRGSDVELRDVDSGSKSNERIRTDETVEMSLGSIKETIRSFLRLSLRSFFGLQNWRVTMVYVIGDDIELIDKMRDRVNDRPEVWRQTLESKRLQVEQA